MKTKFMLALPVLLLSASLYAGDERGNGGDNIGIEFKNIASQAIAEMQQYPKHFPKFDSANFLLALENAKIIIVDIPLYVESHGVIQDSVAKNVKYPDRILINRARWKALKDNAKMQKTIAVHELAGLLEIESTGVYTLSQIYYQWNFASSIAAGTKSNIVKTSQQSSNFSISVKYAVPLAEVPSLIAMMENEGALVKVTRCHLYSGSRLQFDTCVIGVYGGSIPTDLEIWADIPKSEMANFMEDAITFSTSPDLKVTSNFRCSLFAGNRTDRYRQDNCVATYR